MADQGISWEGQLVVDIYGKGIDGGYRTPIVEMTVEAYNTFLAGYDHSPVILSGEALHRLNCEYILQYIKAVGKIEYKRRDKSTLVLHSSDVSGNFEAADLLVDSLTLWDTITLLKQQKLISEELALDMHALRHLRNRVVHSSRPPRLDLYNPPIELSNQDIREIVKLSLMDNDLPLKYRQHTFRIRVFGKEVDYIVDQEKLGIEVEKIEPKRRIVVISLALLFLAMKHINRKLPISLNHNYT